MFGSVVQDTPSTPLARLNDLVDDLHHLELGALPGAELLELLCALETQRNRLASVDHALIAEVESRGLAGERACRSTAVLLRQLLRVSPGEASARVKAAADLGPRRGLTGELLAPIYPGVAAAQGDGSISSAHARVITTTIDALPDAVQAEHEGWVQPVLLENAQQFDPTLLAQIARHITDTLDPDGTLTQDSERERRRELRIQPRPDGSAHLEAELTGLCAEALRTVLDTLARPTPETDAGKDPRSAGQRQHDGLHDAMLMLLRTTLLPECNGVAATILITITDQQAHTGHGLARTGHGAHLPTQTALSLAGDARLIPVVLGRTREITAYGSTHRIFTEGPRLAMTARDHGCSFPGCDQPPARCQAHHIIDHTLTRRTTVDDGTLLCGPHHRNHTKQGWTCRMINGIPHWTPPTWLDPTQTHRRNRTTHSAADTRSLSLASGSRRRRGRRRLTRVAERLAVVAATHHPVSASARNRRPSGP